MKFDLTKACPGCPFLKDGESDQAVRLRTARIIDIHNSLTNWHGGPFPCHKTVDYDREDDEDLGEGHRLPGPGERHCAGALGYLANLGSDGPQGVKFAVYGRDKTTYAAYGPPSRCFESLADWKATAEDADEAGADPVPCETCEPGCLAPAGMMTHGGIVEGTESADCECSECGSPVCSECVSEDGLCGLCAGWGEEE